jgi:hypothetical protein
MTCHRCRKSFDEKQARCPHCGEPNPDSGRFQTSTVLISAGGADLVYRSLEEVPVHLRTRLLKSTHGGNSATILIADRRGRNEIAKSLRNLPGPAQRRLRRSVLDAEDGSGALAWLTPGRRKAILVVVVSLALALIGIAFTHHW